MSESNDNLTTILIIILVICISGWHGEHNSYKRLKKEYLDYQNFVHSTVDHIPYISNKIIDYELYIDDVKDAMADN